jgi:hypothetical protein
MNDLESLVLQHTEVHLDAPTDCKPERVFDAQHFWVSIRGIPAKETLVRAVEDHVPVECDLKLFDGRWHSLVQVRGWLGDKELAMRAMILLHWLGLVDLDSPAKYPKIARAKRQEMVNSGFFSMKWKGVRRDEQL